MRIDCVATRWWGVPVSTVCAARAYWGHRLGLCSIYMIPVAFLFSIVLYLYVLKHIDDIGGIRAVDSVEEDYADVQAKLLYSWFNTNPIHVLKSRYVQTQVPRNIR